MICPCQVYCCQLLNREPRQMCSVWVLPEGPQATRRSRAPRGFQAHPSEEGHTYNVEGFDLSPNGNGHDDHDYDKVNDDYEDDDDDDADGDDEEDGDDEDDGDN